MVKVLAFHHKFIIYPPPWRMAGLVFQPNKKLSLLHVLRGAWRCRGLQLLARPLSPCRRQTTRGSASSLPGPSFHFGIWNETQMHLQKAIPQHSRNNGWRNLRHRSWLYHNVYTAHINDISTKKVAQSQRQMIWANQIPPTYLCGVFWVKTPNKHMFLL